MAEAISSTPFGPLTAEAIQSMSMQQYAEHRNRLLGASTLGGLFGLAPYPPAHLHLTEEEVELFERCCEMVGLPRRAWAEGLRAG